MARSPGYRANKANREELKHLRSLLSSCTSSNWQRASLIMQEIARVSGHTYGPMGSSVQPRACKFCHYYGHTRQHCKKLRAAQDAYSARVALEDKLRIEQYAHIEVTEYDPLKSAQALDFDRLQMPFFIRPDTGPMFSAEQGKHAGKWTYDKNYNVCLNG